MAEYQQHIEKYKHNHTFFSLGINKSRGDFTDWEITARFYASVHLIEAVLAKEYREHSTSHNDRNQRMAAHTERFPRESTKDYATLKNLAQRARYSIGPMTPDEATLAQTCLENLELQYRQYINQEADGPAAK